MAFSGTAPAPPPPPPRPPSSPRAVPKILKAKRVHRSVRALGKMRGVPLSQAWMTAHGANFNFQLLAAVVSQFLQPSVSQGSSSSFLAQLSQMAILGAVFLSSAAFLLENLRSHDHPLPDPQSQAHVVEQAEARRTSASAAAWLQLYAYCLFILAFFCQFLIQRVTHGAGWRNLLPALLVATFVLLGLWRAFHSPAFAAGSNPAAATDSSASISTSDSDSASTSDSDSASTSISTSTSAAMDNDEELLLHRDIELGQHVDRNSGAMCATSSLEEELPDWKQSLSVPLPCQPQDAPPPTPRRNVESSASGPPGGGPTPK